MSSPGLPSLLVHGWSPGPAVDTMLVAGLLAYTAGVWRLRGRWPLRYSLSFVGGIAAVALALQSGLDGYDDRLLSVHMVQHLLVLLLAPLLLLEGRPALLALRALPRSARRRTALALDRAGRLLRPMPCLLAYAAIVLVLHVPVLFDAAVRHSGLHELEHALLVAAGLLLWWPLLDVEPRRSRRLGALGRVGYVMAAMVPMAAVGAWLAHDVSLAYRVYGAPTRALGVSPIADQETAGAIMWVAGNVFMVLVGLWLTLAALLADERRQAARDRNAALSLEVTA